MLIVCFLRDVLHGDLLDTVNSSDIPPLSAKLTALQLLQAAPTETELQVIRKTENIYCLRKQERFLVRMAGVKDCKQRLSLLRAWEMLPHRLRELQIRVDRVRDSIQAVRESATLRRAIHITLFIGNFLNSGQRQGEASAFTIESLNRLATTKSVLDKRKTLLHLLNDHANLCSLVEEFCCLRSSKHIDAEELQADIEAVRSLLSPPTLKPATDAPDGVDGYPGFLISFHHRFDPLFERLCVSYDQLKISSCEMKSFLGLPDHQNPNWTMVIKALAEFTDVVAKITNTTSM
jgi:hypothetical protein